MSNTIIHNYYHAYQFQPGVGKPTDNGTTETTLSQLSEKTRQDNVSSKIFGTMEPTDNDFLVLRQRTTLSELSLFFLDIVVF